MNVLLGRIRLRRTGLSSFPRASVLLIAEGAKAWYHNDKLTATTARRWRALLAKAGTAVESGFGRTDLPVNMPTAKKSGAAGARSIPPLSSLVISEKELAVIGDAFKTCLTRKITVAGHSRSKLPSASAEAGQRDNRCPQENSGH
jgi:hypothetical protein